MNEKTFSFRSVVISIFITYQTNKQTNKKENILFLYTYNIKKQKIYANKKTMRMMMKNK